MDSKERRDNPPTQPSSEAAADFRALVENLAQPVVIMDRAGKIRFMNPCAERLLAQGLKERVEAQLRNPAHRQAVSQVRFRVEGAADLILRIRLSDIEWQGQPAMQVGLMDMTPYVTTAQRLSQEIAKFKAHEGRSQNLREKLETQLKSIAAERDRVYATSLQRLAQETARFQKSREEAQDEAQRLRGKIAEAEKTAAQLQAQVAEGDEAKAENERLRRKIAESHAAFVQLHAECGQFQAQVKDLTAAQAQSKSELDQERAERKKMLEDAARLQREVADALRAPTEAGTEADRARQQLQAEERSRRELDGGRQAQLLNEMLRKKLTEVRHAAQQGQIEREALVQQVQSQAAELEKARADLLHEAASRQRTQEENQRLRRAEASSMP
jgi:hypothetical protein